MDKCGNIMLKNDDRCTIEPKASEEIKVKIHIPEKIHDNIRKEKINRIYDILNPEISQ